MSNDYNALLADNLALIVLLRDAITEYRDALAYKSDYLIEKHNDAETLAELQGTLDELKGKNKQTLNHLQADAIDNLNFPTEIRKTWSASEVQQWLKEQAQQKRK